MAIAATFSDFMNPATLTSTTFTLTGPGGPVAGTVAVPNGITATFSPAADLAPNALYIATITTEVQSTAGLALAMNHLPTIGSHRGPRQPEDDRRFQ